MLPTFLPNIYRKNQTNILQTNIFQPNKHFPTKPFIKTHSIKKPLFSLKTTIPNQLFPPSKTKKKKNFLLKQ